MASKPGTRLKIAAIVLVPLIAVSAYLWLIVRAGCERTDGVLAKVAELEHDGLKPSTLPAGWLRDLLTVEDPGFYEHDGIDLSTPGAGMTTITQGLVKIHYFDEFKPGIAKLKQSVLALVLDSRLTKEQQLVLFLNTAPLGSIGGQAISGFENAAVAYFGKSFEELSHREFISLVAMLVGPGHFNVAANPAENANRVSRIMALLAGECSVEDRSDVYYENCP